MKRCIETLSKQKKLFAIGAILILVIGVTIGATLLVMKMRQGDKDEVNQSVVHSALMDMAASVKTAKSYSTLPKEEGEMFLQEQARLYAVDPKLQAVTPDTLRGLCVQKTEGDLIRTATQVRRDVGEEKFEAYVSMFTHAKMEARSNCYSNFDPTGKEDMPAMMKH